MAAETASTVRGASRRIGVRRIFRLDAVVDFSGTDQRPPAPSILRF